MATNNATDDLTIDDATAYRHSFVERLDNLENGNNGHEAWQRTRVEGSFQISVTSNDEDRVPSFVEQGRSVYVGRSHVTGSSIFVPLPFEFDTPSVNRKLNEAVRLLLIAIDTALVNRPEEEVAVVEANKAHAEAERRAGELREEAAAAAMATTDTARFRREEKLSLKLEVLAKVCVPLLVYQALFCLAYLALFNRRIVDGIVVLASLCIPAIMTLICALVNRSRRKRRQNRVTDSNIEARQGGEEGEGEEDNPISADISLHMLYQMGVMAVPLIIFMVFLGRVDALIVVFLVLIGADLFLSSVIIEV
jgi:hypothetical protein